MVKLSCLIVSWFQDNLAPLDGGNAARRLLDNVSYVTEAVSSLSSPSSRALTNWITDQVAPDYWVPNSEITVSLEIKNASITKFLKRLVFENQQQKITCLQVSRNQTDQQWSDHHWRTHECVIVYVLPHYHTIWRTEGIMLDTNWL